MQELIGDLTVEQFVLLISKVCGVLFGCILACSFLAALITASVDGWAFRKGSLYYGSLKYLNQCFKRLKNCGTVGSLDKVHDELVTVISLLRYQRIIPKFLYVRLFDKLGLIYRKRKIEISDYWK